jgi:hypothetical protein
MRFRSSEARRRPSGCSRCGRDVRRICDRALVIADVPLAVFATFTGLALTGIADFGGGLRARDRVEGVLLGGAFATMASVVLWPEPATAKTLSTLAASLRSAKLRRPGCTAARKPTLFMAFAECAPTRDQLGRRVAADRRRHRHLCQRRHQLRRRTSQAPARPRL